MYLRKTPLNRLKTKHQSIKLAGIGYLSHMKWFLKDITGLSKLWQSTERAVKW
jgi:hypothetical protein